jgi:putative transposase
MSHEWLQTAPAGLSAGLRYMTKRVTRPMLGFKSFEAAQDTLVGIELMHMIKKKQMVPEAGDEGLTAAELFYSLAA